MFFLRIIKIIMLEYFSIVKIMFIIIVFTLIDTDVSASANADIK